MIFLGLDIGTSAVKAVLIDGRENILASASAPIGTMRPRPSWSEQDPEEWWRAVRRIATELRSRAPAEWHALAAIGLSGQMHGTVLLDRENRIIRPAILWNDGRAVEEARILERDVRGIGEIAGVKPMAGFSAPKLLWLKRHEPDSCSKIARVLLPKDYVRFKLSGEFATDMSDASGSLWLDSGKRKWSVPIVEASGLDLAQLPRLLEGSEISGVLRPEIAREWGLGPNVTIAAGSGDVAAGAAGIGAVNEGDAFISLGTSAQYFIARDRYLPAPHALIHAFCHALPRRWFQMAALLNGASCLAWAASALNGDLSNLLSAAERSFTAPSSLLFLPYLTGERTPHNDPDARGTIFGLTPGANRGEIMLAVLEGVALSLADCQEVLERTGARVDELAVIGGGARSHLWMRILASLLNRRLKLYSGGEDSASLGAARLARIASTGEPPAEVCRAPPVKLAIDPEPALVEAYAPRLARFRALYLALKPTSPISSTSST
jgi:xylulokinase